MTWQETDAALPRYVVTGGGDPSPEQLAAVVIALTPAAAVQDPGGPQRSRRGWADAALLEGVGHRTFVAHPDLAGGRFPLG